MVKLVIEENFSVREAAKILRIKYTTAKPLIQKYRKSGNIERKRAPKKTMVGEERE